MTPTEIRAAVLDDLTAIAPDLDAATLDDADRLQDDLGLDSMDFLNLVAALHRRFGLPIPEQDYPRLVTLGGAVAYVEDALSG